MSYKSILKTTIASTVLATSVSANAEMFWSDNSLTVLKNTSDFSLIGDADVNVLTFEHVSGHNWGDAFFFIDRMTVKDNTTGAESNEIYGEFSPRLSMSYAFDTKLEAGILKDVYFAGTYEFTSSSNGFGFDNYLYGVGADWNIIKDGYFQTNVFYANNELTDNDVQLTLVWGVPFSIANTNWMFDGYTDWSSSADDHAAELHFNPQLRMDVGALWGKPKFFDAGIEYSYWKNKFGLDFADTESVVSVIAKFHI
ncbi:outer membrane protein OmpK [Thalassotalea agarivorans]|uniref:Nucleoside-specific outer membrane channel protein Tsx n=1 Tax=Thalassotalea agarivorans TaxID=349064 RepID=A0A1I0HC98_THASX|nr:outer membrane protein OmpK [Thalassotalea agarivorans]SET81425.1 Nucleoside-specific outer membrane channel protein Tsx [Thalassotalea agarivorans]